ncbi:zinc finger protein 665 isoform X2 [Nasonia vitripennis]|uniref:Uncharacterized protein n=1 Tax=Nasonia vitripennis TaxID=7425 RepID=A0A7M7Q5U9_NASVI|nr:zinc finger protein 665 isoform X2 [Nasonia vitripennis]
MEEVNIYETSRTNHVAGDNALLGNQDANGTCRLCLGTCSSTDQRWALFAGDLPQKLMAFAAVQVQENDGLPRVICTNCRNLVYMSYNFKCQVEKCDQDLRHSLLMRHSTNHWPETIINSCMAIQNEENSTNTHEQFLFEIGNACDMNSSNSTFEPNILVAKNNTVSQGMSNLSLETHRCQEIQINFEAHYSMNEQSDKNNFIRTESQAVKENSNQSDDEKPLILRTKRHKCKYCIKSFANLSLLEKHAVIHKKTPETTYSCYLCDQQFPSVDKVQSHALSVHNLDMCKDKIMDYNKTQRNSDANNRKICDDSNSNESNSSFYNTEDNRIGQFYCKFCPRQFTYHKPFIDHIKTHPNYSDKLVKLVNNLNEIPDASSHILDEEGNSQSQSFENNVQENSNNINDFTDRNSTDLTDNDDNDLNEGDSSNDNDSNDDNIPESSIQCNQCGVLVATMRNLKRHLLTHTGFKYNCSICGKDFSRPDKLKEHQQLKHKEELFDSDDESVDDNSPTKSKKDKSNRPHKCSICPKAFAQAQSLANHEERHRRARDVQKRYLCEVCSKCFAQSGSLVAHMRTHTGVKPYVCNICSRGFTKSTYLQLHLRTHSGEKPYICQYCSRAFARANTLARHITMHTGEAKYQCQICSKSFRRLTSLNEHTYTHTGQRPYACKICSKRYNNAGSLYAHTKKCKVTQASGVQQSNDETPPQTDIDAASQVLIFTEKKSDETITDKTIATEPSCQFMVANVPEQKTMTTDMLEPFTIQESQVYELNSKQFKTPYYGLYPNM